jgi:hypothetical protein
VIERDDLRARVAGAVIAAVLVAAVTLALNSSPIVDTRVRLGYLVVLPLVALAPSRRFVLAQMLAAAGMFLAARLTEDHTWWELALAAAQELVFFVILWRAPLQRLAVRRVIIAIATVVMIPLIYTANDQGAENIDPLLGAWRHFILLVVIMSATRRDAASTARNLALAWLGSVPVPLERADTADRRLVTMLTGGLLFVAGMLGLEAIKRYGGWFGFPHLAWTAGPLRLIGSSIVLTLGLMVRVGGFGCMLMGHCFMLGIRIAPPIGNPLRFTNLAEAWRGTGFYMYRFVYDAYYRQFFPNTGGPIAVVARVTAVFLVMACMHFVWGGSFIGVVAISDWLILGLATGITVVYLQERSKRRLRNYKKGQRPAPPPRWHWLLVPVFIIAVLVFRGFTEEGLTDPQIVDHLSALVSR